MTTYNCPRCGSPCTAERCQVCGRGPEPLLARLGELDTVLAVMPATLRSRAAVEVERRQVLDNLTKLAAQYLAEAERQARVPETTPQAPTSTGAVAAPQTAPDTPPGGAPQAMPLQSAAPPQIQPYPHTPPAGAFPMPRERGEVGSKTVQTMLLGLGGLLVAAALIIFTAVAWRNMGNGGRAATLGGVTLLLLAVPIPLKRFRLWATAETFAALAALALWCTTLAGYYLYRPADVEFGPQSVGAWTAGVLAVLAIYRAAARLTATGWAMLPLAAVGLAYAAASDLAVAVALMLAIAVALGAAAWITATRPSHYERSDLWVSRFLTCAAVVAACSAGLRAAFGLDGPVVPPVAGAVAVLAAANLFSVHFARKLGASLTAVLVAASAATSLVLAAWTLAIRSDAPELAMPSIALLGAAIVALVHFDSRDDFWPLSAYSTAGLTAAAAFATVTFDAPDLTAYLVVFLTARLASALPADPMRTALRTGSYVIGAGTAVIASGIALFGGIGVLLDPHTDPFSWEVPIVLLALAAGSILLPKRFRVDAVALAVTFAIVSASILLWSEDPARYDAVPTLGFLLCALIGLTAAMASRTLPGRCTGWVALAVWAPLAGLAAADSATFNPGDGWIPFWLTVTAAAMLSVAVGAPRRSRPDRVLAAVLAHVLAGFSIGIGALLLVADWGFGDSDVELFPAAQLGVYTVALVGAAFMAPVRKWGYVIAALSTGSLGWWWMLGALEVETLEFYTAPPAAIVFLIGLWRLEQRPETGSWSTLALPILVGIGPSLLLALNDGDELRRVGVGAAAVAVIIAGLMRRWQAPLVLGSIALAIMTINELALLWHHIPVWIPPAIGGAILIGAGATFERRRRDVRRIRDSLKSMR
ncbi:SCO7613 C-terminal domain-containing membrane protein [Glycomyces rhizosphaerae]|uniref:SCO7613 C-terminal domain-containing membrane protein n=1 Tax=Glycomyces rhizosphaerae TaxID=2054422 RepID=A0ABV7PS67_9ACTN